MVLGVELPQGCRKVVASIAVDERPGAAGAGVGGPRRVDNNLGKTVEPEEGSWGLPDGRTGGQVLAASTGGDAVNSPHSVHRVGDIVKRAVGRIAVVSVVAVEVKNTKSELAGAAGLVIVAGLGMVSAVRQNHCAADCVGRRAAAVAGGLRGPSSKRMKGRGIWERRCRRSTCSFKRKKKKGREEVRRGSGG